MARYRRPAELSSALEMLSHGGWTVLAGGTDHFPARVDRPTNDDILDLSNIDELRGIEERDDHWRLGSMVVWSQLAQAGLPSLCDGLVLAAREIGGQQIQNRGTVGGNICNASPAADGTVVLLSLGAEAEFRSAAGRSLLPLSDFVTGNRRTALGPGELLTAVRIPKPSGRARTGFLKLGARKYLVISIASVAGHLGVDRQGRVVSAGVSVGACSEVPARLAGLEAALIGCKASAALADLVVPEHFGALTPIDDCRGTGAYRSDAVVTLTRRLLGQLGGGR